MALHVTATGPSEVVETQEGAGRLVISNKQASCANAAWSIAGWDAPGRSICSDLHRPPDLDKVGSAASARGMLSEDDCI